MLKIVIAVVLSVGFYFLSQVVLPKSVEQLLSFVACIMSGLMAIAFTVSLFTPKDESEDAFS